jgi:long-chain acyl-CoA synthetase
MQGYWQHPDETARALSPDGFLLTGDMGTMDAHGYVTLLDRKKDMINVSGLKVFPNEVEEVATMHPKVLEAAAVGVPDDIAGEAVRLVVVPRNGQLSQSELRAHLAANLAAYKVPKYIDISDQPLPKSHIGKVLRRLVSDAPPSATKRH